MDRLIRTADFKRLLSLPPRWRSAHFAVHHLGEPPCEPVPRPERPDPPPRELSTGDERVHPQGVDEREQPCVPTATDCWLGCVVPKRQAKRAVTRNLIKRQVRAAALRHEASLAGGLWLVRLRQGFPVEDFPSADSPGLRRLLRAELDGLFAKTHEPKSRRTAQPGASREAL